VDTKKLLKKHRIAPNLEKDQYFLEDQEVLEKVVELANVQSSEVVLEIGVGIGNLTELLAQKAKKVVGFEIDERFKPILKNLPKNVEIIYEDAWKGLRKFKSSPGGKFWNFDKIVSNPPYRLIEPVMHAFTLRPFKKMVLLIPKKFIRKIGSNPVFSSFYNSNLALEVSKNSFWPQPKTNSAVVIIEKLPNPQKTKNLGLFLRQYLYLHEQQLARNALREGLIKAAKLFYNKILTKNQARKIIKDSRISKSLLERHPDNPEIYNETESKLGKISLEEVTT